MRAGLPLGSLSRADLCLGMDKAQLLLHLSPGDVPSAPLLHGPVPDSAGLDSWGRYRLSAGVGSWSLKHIVL